MSAIKKFFEKKKLNSKFKKAGQGHTLAEQTSSSSSQDSQTPSRPDQRIVRTEPSHVTQMAGLAAQQRIESRTAPTMANRSQNVIRAEARRELEAERQNRNLGESRVASTKEEIFDSPRVDGVFFTCSLVGPEILPKAEMDAKIKEFLYDQLEEEPGLTSCLIIHTCNKDKEKVRLCVETLTKCLDNIIENPTEEKFRKIRVNSKAFQEKIAGVDGSLEFLHAAGFVQKRMMHTNNVEEEFFVFCEDDTVDLTETDGKQLESKLEVLSILRDALAGAEPIRPELDRNVRVLSPMKLLEKIELPYEFYTLTPAELKREQQYRTELVEMNQQLRTKAMRERDAIKERRKYRFCFIRIRFPSGPLLQGTFKTWESLSSVKFFVKEHLNDEHREFILSTVTGQQLTADDMTLADLDLIPAVVIHFAWNSLDESIPAAASETYLKPETLLLCSDL